SVGDRHHAVCLALGSVGYRDGAKARQSDCHGHHARGHNECPIHNDLPVEFLTFEIATTVGRDVTPTRFAPNIGILQLSIHERWKQGYRRTKSKGQESSAHSIFFQPRSGCLSCSWRRQLRFRPTQQMPRCPLYPAYGAGNPWIGSPRKQAWSSPEAVVIAF